MQSACAKISAIAPGAPDNGGEELETSVGAHSRNDQTITPIAPVPPLSPAVINNSSGALTRLAEAISEISSGDGDRLRFGDIIESFDIHGSIGAALFVMTLPVLLPLPPGASMIVSLPLLAIAPQLIVGHHRLWLPKWVSNLTLKRTAFADSTRRLIPVLRRIDRVGRPRLTILTGPIGARLVGVIATAIAVVEVLPIPFSTLLPALALLLLSLGLISRDGLILLSGYAMSLVSTIPMLLGVKGAALVMHWVRTVL